MPLDASAQTVLDILAKAKAKGTPAIGQGTPAEARELFRRGCEALDNPPAAVGTVDALHAAGPAGPIPIRLYRPRDAGAAALPVTVFYHGGGWVIGDLDTHDVLCRELVNRGRFAVAAVDYRLAPEHPYPAAVEDAFSALAWVAEHGAALGLDRHRIAVAGDSAGGTLSAVVALLAREAGGPPLRGQALLYPATDLVADSRSHREFTDYALTAQSIRWFHGHYLRTEADRKDWRCSPLRAESLAGLPPAYVLTAGYDPLRDEGKAYAEGLAASGVPVRYRCFEGQLHGFLNMGKVVPEAAQALAEIADALAAELAAGA